ncbi:hypothetical protein FEM03_11325 [Phragmitibacter flavus]|uniref:Glycosyltransferase family 1 protein n=1 Tax=Phragmitibacter flavus TaxID=2576071 RepID=A0A5R8KF19_9BACT|nr:hypothetical protein [Phragmitibacter flavus]TLD70888.1 hypothetical protein FEM03_11325 [Phragmitibacter flavus]
MTEAKVKVLVIGQDNHFAGLEGVQVDHVLTRKTYTPDAEAIIDTSTYCSASTACLRFFRGHYHLALLPAIDLTWPHNFSPMQKRLRAVFRSLVSLPFSRFLTKLLIPGSTHIAVIDRYDATDIHEQSAQFFHANSYWKVNPATANASYRGKPVQFLPLWVFEPPSGWSTVNWEDRDIDLFFASSINAPPRERGLQFIKNLAQSHPELRLHIADKPLSADAFHEHMSRSRMVLSTEGVGFHCFRHYQTMLHEAVPLVNHNDQVQTNLIDGENSLRYHENQNDFNRVVLSALQDLPRLATVARQARLFAQQHHTPNGIARRILAHASLQPTAPSNE